MVGNSRVVAVVPTIGEAPQLPTLVDRLLADGVDAVLLLVNRLGADVRVALSPGRVHRIDHRGSIYDSWNMGLDFAKALDAVALVVNDDVTLAEGAARLVERAFSLDPGLAVVGFDYRCQPGEEFRLDYVQGTYRHGGIAGFAFAVDPTRTDARVDERFEWWYGDDDLMFQVHADGLGLAIARTACVQHVAETTSSRHPWTYEARARDTVRFQEKWGLR